MARAIVLLLLLCITGCAASDKPCVQWAKQYVNGHSMWDRQYGERPNLPAIAVVQTGPDSYHAIVITSPHGDFVDNGFLGGHGRIDLSEVVYWLRRRP